MTTQPGYHAVAPQVDLPAMEHDVLAFWQQHQTFEASLAQTDGAPRWTFYEGPPTANGMPGTHHIEARVFKDLFPRYKTMRGMHVERKAGWDCHGLPVELAVEKELGFSGKPDIEAYGIEAFNEKCRESVLRHVGAFSDLTERMGYWVNMDEAYVTMSTQYVESLWWALKQIHSKGLLEEDYRVAPYCPRCGTALSDHELAQGYEDVVDPSVYVRFPLTSGPLAGTADLLVWTTTPWTLPSNLMLAVGKDIDYAVMEEDGQKYVLAQALLDEYEKLGVPIRQIVFREGSHGDYYYTNRAAAALNIPALTSEFCFIDNEEDQKFIDSEEDWQKQARAQCNAILYYFTQVQY